MTAVILTMVQLLLKNEIPRSVTFIHKVKSRELPLTPARVNLPLTFALTSFHTCTKSTHDQIQRLIEPGYFLFITDGLIFVFYLVRMI